MTTDPVSGSASLLRVNQISRESLKSPIGEAEEKGTAVPEEESVAGGAEEKRATEREHDQEDLTQEMLEVIDSVRSFGDFRRTQKKECFNLVRRLQMVVPLLEEISELEIPISDTAYAKLCDLAKAISAAKKLLRCCHDGSKIHLAVEREAVAGKFYVVYENLNRVLAGIPYHELGITDEVKEQVELMSVQLERAKRRTDTQDMELAMDLMVVLSENEDLDVDRAILERLARRLQLQTLPDLRAETMAIKKLIKECGEHAESTQRIVDLLNRFKKIAGIEDRNGLSEVAVPKYLEKCASLMIPNDFLCPISLEIMTDPVIVATGQTFERRSIQKWLDAGHQTCPKTRQTLDHLSLAPNYALRNLILQWCEKNKVELLKKEADLDAEPPDHEEEISSLVQDLSSIHLDKQRRAVKKIRMLSKENPDHRIAIAENGGIPVLVSLLTYPDPKIQENTVTALLNLSIDEGNKKLIVKEGAIPAIIEILKTGTVAARENSAAALFSLSMLDEIKLIIGNLNGIPPLVDLLQNGTMRGKKDAATALFNLVLNTKNKARAIEAGIVAPLLQVLGDKNLGMVDEALSILFLLSLHPDGCNAMGQPSFVQSLVEFIKEGTPKNKECALSVLLELGSHDSSLLTAACQFGVHEHLDEIIRCGTDRAQRKARALMSKCEQVQ